MRSTSARKVALVPRIERQHYGTIAAESGNRMVTEQAPEAIGHDVKFRRLLPDTTTFTISARRVRQQNDPRIVFS